MAVVVVVVVLCYVLIQVRVKCFPLHSGCDMTITSSESTVEPQTNCTHPFNGPFFGTTQMSQYQKGKTNLDFTEEWQWHHMGYVQVCTSLQTDNHASTLPLSFYRPDALLATQPTASKH